MKEIIASIVISTSQVASVYDGDTFFVDLPNCYLPVVCDRVGVRVRGVDTPEIKGSCPFERELSKRSKEFVIQQMNSSEYVRLEDIERGKYFRIVATVYLDNKALHEMLVDQGLAREYWGGKRQSWCSDK